MVRALILYFHMVAYKAALRVNIVPKNFFFLERSGANGQAFVTAWLGKVAVVGVGSNSGRPVSTSLFLLHTFFRIYFYQTEIYTNFP